MQKLKKELEKHFNDNTATIDKLELEKLSIDAKINVTAEDNVRCDALRTNFKNLLSVNTVVETETN